MTSEEMQPAFSEQDAQNLLTLVQAAPLPGGLHQARQVDQLCLRAQRHFTAYFAAGAASTPMKSGKKRNGKGAEMEAP